MKALVIFDSVFGNTEKVARAISASLGADTPVLNVGSVSAQSLAGVDTLFVGSPTRGFRPTPAITAFLAALPSDCLKGVKAASFDTRIPLESIKNPLFRLIVRRGGYADLPIAAELVRLGAVQPIPSAGFIVLKSEGPLQEGELERAAAWANSILSD